MAEEETTPNLKGKRVPGLGDRELGDYPTSDGDLVVNLNNQFPDPLNTDNNPMFYRALRPLLTAHRKTNNQLPFDVLTISDLPVGMVCHKVALDLLHILNDILTVRATPSTFTKGTRGFSLGILFILAALIAAFFTTIGHDFQTFCRPFSWQKMMMGPS